jgi:hypothetical protein
MVSDLGERTEIAAVNEEGGGEQREAEDMLFTLLTSFSSAHLGELFYCVHA